MSAPSLLSSTISTRRVERDVSVRAMSGLLPPATGLRPGAGTPPTRVLEGLSSRTAHDPTDRLTLGYRRPPRTATPNCGTAVERGPVGRNLDAERKLVAGSEWPRLPSRWDSGTRHGCCRKYSTPSSNPVCDTSLPRRRDGHGHPSHALRRPPGRLAHRGRIAPSAGRADLRSQLAVRLAATDPDLADRVRRLDDWHAEVLADLVADAHALSATLAAPPGDGSGDTKVD